LTAFLISAMRSACPAQFILLSLFPLITCGEGYNFWSALCSFLRPIVTSSLFYKQTFS
jgi:hypothetical protein